MKEEVKETSKRVHHGRNCARLRKASGKKQTTLAVASGMSQQTWSRYEQKPVIEDEVLIRMAKALGVPVSIIKEMEEDPMTIIVENNDFHDNVTAGGYLEFQGDNINSNVDAILELQKKNEELHAENKELQERLLKAEQDKNAYLEKLIKNYEDGKE